MSSYPQPTTGLGIPARVVVSPPNITLAVGDTCQLVPSLTDVAGNALGSSGPFSFTRYAASIIGVDSSGLITALAPGVAEITVAYTDARGSLDTTVTVSVAPQPAQTADVLVTKDKLPGAAFCSLYYMPKNIPLST